MNNDSKITGKLKEQIAKYADSLSMNMKKPAKKFIRQIVFGIQAAKDVKLSNISRSLKEEIALIKTENRLARNLSKTDLTEEISKSLLKRAGKRVGKETVLSLDLSDIRKEYAKSMEHLALVRDGSTGEVGSPGYWLCSVFGAEVKGEELIPLYQELYSQKADGFESENVQIIKAIEAVSESTGNKGIWTIDRGGDRKKLYEYLFDKELDFCIRLNSKRDIIIKDKTQNVLRAAQKFECKEEIGITVNRDGQEEEKTVFAGSGMIQLPFNPEKPLKMVVIKGFGEEPLMIATSLLDKKDEEILEIYLTRWKCEESFRFMKQSYKLEDVRVRSYIGLRNLICLVLAVFYFVSIELGRKLRLSILFKKIYAKAKRFFQMPSFKHYAIADGIYSLLFAGLKGIDNLALKFAPQELTLSLPF